MTISRETIIRDVSLWCLPITKSSFAFSLLCYIFRLLKSICSIVYHVPTSIKMQSIFSSWCYVDTMTQWWAQNVCGFPSPCSSTHTPYHNYLILPQISTVAQSSSNTPDVTSRRDRSITQRVQIIADALEAQFLITAYSHVNDYTHTHIGKKT